MNDIVSKILYIIKHEGLSSIIKRPWRFFIQLINRAIILAFNLFPIDRKKVVLESQGDYSDNVRAFYEYASNNNLGEFNYIWLVQTPSLFNKKDKGLFVSRNEYSVNFKANYHIATAHYFIFSHPYWLKTWRKNQIVINTTHSVAQLKATPKRKGKLLYDYVLTCSNYCTEIRKKTFSDDCDNHFLCIGQPRLDLMFRHDDSLEKLAPEHCGKKLILCMETFKQTTTWNDGGVADVYAINVISSTMEIELLDSFLEDNNCIMIIKIHHLQDLSMIRNHNVNNILYLTDFDLQQKDVQLNQLLENADILLTDYSSVFYDYLLVDRPIGFLIGDIKNYKRGFIMDNPINEMPGEKIHNINELICFLKNCIDGKDYYENDRKTILNKVFNYQDNNNSYRLMMWLINDNITTGDNS